MMSDNTIAENKTRFTFRQSDSVWLFGYGSLIFKADFSYSVKKPASIENWTRRFWQGSHDHRGTEKRPGRVVTLVKSENAICHGMAYKISARCLKQLDHREKNGYLRFMINLTFEDGRQDDGLVYIATESNKAFLGPAAAAEIAEQILAARGPSGSNLDYFRNLAGALKEMSVYDPHILAIEEQIDMRSLQKTAEASAAGGARKTDHPGD